MARLSLAEATALATRALQGAGANPAMARATASALVRAEAQGIASHGLSRVPQYATHLRNGRANGAAEPRIERERGAALLVDAGQGLAFAACDLAVAGAVAKARELGIALGAVRESHHAGVLVDHLRPAAEAGMVALAFTNSPSAMPVAGGKRALLADDAQRSVRDELKLNRADVGWYQIRKALQARNASGDFIPVNFKPFEEAYKTLTEKLQPMVYELGFLKS